MDHVIYIGSSSFEVMSFFVFVLYTRRALAMFNREERAKKENQILSDFRSMIHKVTQQQKP